MNNQASTGAAALDHRGKVVLVTGGTKGIGAGIARGFLAAGATVVVCGRNAPEVLPEAGGRTADFIPADVRDVESLQALFASIRERFDYREDIGGTASAQPGDRIEKRLLHPDDHTHGPKQFFDDFGIGVIGGASQCIGSSTETDQRRRVRHYANDPDVRSARFLENLRGESRDNRYDEFAAQGRPRFVQRVHSISRLHAENDRVARRGDVILTCSEA